MDTVTRIVLFGLVIVLPILIAVALNDGAWHTVALAAVAYVGVLVVAGRAPRADREDQ